MRKWICLLVIFCANLLQSASLEEADFPEGPNCRTGTATHFDQGWDSAKTMPLIRSAGFGWIRDEVQWSEVERKKGQYALPIKTKRWLQDANRNGLRVILILNFSNPIYSDNYDVTAYASAAAWLAKETADQVDAIEILNEPHNFGFSRYYGGAWNGRQEDGSDAPWIIRYVQLLNRAGDAIKKANPRMKVIGLGSVPPSNFRMLRQGVRPTVDGVVDHPYSFRGMPEYVPYEASERHVRRDGFATSDAAGTFRSQIAMYRLESECNQGPRELWLTEWGFPTFTKLNPLGLFEGVSEIVQAKYILRRFVEALALDVLVSIQYDFRDDGLSAFNPEDNFGLVDFKLRAKPAFLAVQQMNRFLRDSRPATLLKITLCSPTPANGTASVPPLETESIRCYAFTRSDGYLLIALWRAIPAADAPSTVHAKIAVASRGVQALHAVDLLNSTRTEVPFTSLDNELVVSDFEIHDYPTLLIGR
jgi:hypothetical protein